MATTDPRTRYAFFRGTTDEAITASIERCLPLVCVVVDGSGESSIWEYEYLVDDEVLTCSLVHDISLRALRQRWKEGWRKLLLTLSSTLSGGRSSNSCNPR